MRRALDSPLALRQAAPVPDTPDDEPPAHGPFAQLIGYTLAEWAEDRAVVTLRVDERHLNRSGIMHGGVLTALIDTACGYSGCYRAPPARSRRAMTLALHTQFLGTVHAGTRLSAVGRRTGGGRQIFFTSCEVRDQDGHLVGRGDGTFRYRRDA